MKGGSLMEQDYFYDLHLHSCLSPCGDIDMTPNNLVNMAMLQGLDLIALTDHNSCKNCPAALKVAEDLPITVLPGMELTTSEEIHVVFVLPGLEEAMALDDYVHRHLPPLENRHEIFGEQIIMDSQDRVTGIEPYLLINATDISIDDTWALAQKFGGLCWPAHIDRASNSIMATFGYLSPDLPHPAVEIWRPEVFLADEAQQKATAGYHIFTCSDAHALTSIAEPEHRLRLEQPGFAGLAALLSHPKQPK